jgi:hypothetical protein
MPDYSNQITRYIESIIGPFLFKDSDKPEELSSNLKSLGPVELDNNAFYHG